MAKWEHRPIIPYFKDAFDSREGNCLPYLPEEWTCNVPGRNEEIDILHFDDSGENLSGTLNLLKRPGLKTWKIDCFFSHPQKPEFANVRKSKKWSPREWVEFFESAMYKRKVLEMTVAGLNLVTYVTVENFEHTKRSGEELDTYYTIELKEYRFEKIKKEEINITQNWVGNDSTGYEKNVQGDRNNMGGNAFVTGTIWYSFATEKVIQEMFLKESKLFNNIQKVNAKSGKRESNLYLVNMPVTIMQRSFFTLRKTHLTEVGNAVYGELSKLDKYSIAPTFFTSYIIEIVRKYILEPKDYEKESQLLSKYLSEFLSKYCNNEYASILGTMYRLDKEDVKNALSLLYKKEDDNEISSKYKKELKLEYGYFEDVKENTAQVKPLNIVSENITQLYDPNSNTFSDKPFWVIDKEEEKEIHKNIRNEAFKESFSETSSFFNIYGKDSKYKY